MAEYIEREKAMDAVRKTGFYSGLGKMSLCKAARTLRYLPAAAVRPVVLCRDCKWCHAGYCEKYDDLIPFGCANKPWADWFCADGEKREES